jgi:type IV pilus assembly protein PilE
MPPIRNPIESSICRHGFTLVELMIVMVIMGILSALVYPSFTNSLHKVRRSDAIEALLSLQQAQERWRSNNTQYASAISLLGISTTSTDGFYTLSLPTTPNSTSYSAVATASSGRSQWADSQCRTLRVDVNPSSNPGETIYSPSECWSQ